MSFLQKIAVLAAKKKFSYLRKDEDIEHSLRALERSRVQLMDALHREINPKSPAYRHALNNFRRHWYDFYKFHLEPKQEERYLNVLKDKAEPDPVEEKTED